MPPPRPIDDLTGQRVDELLAGRMPDIALRAAADLKGEAVIIGVLNRFEVWSPERWESFLADSERLLDDATLGVEWPPSPKPNR